MKHYGVKGTQYPLRIGRFVACWKWSHCKDDDEYFGTDDINEAYQFAAFYNSPNVEVFEKTK